MVRWAIGLAGLAAGVAMAGAPGAWPASARATPRSAGRSRTIEKRRRGEDQMIRIALAGLAATLVASATAAQDAAPPGCRWQGGGTLACKDGHGHWRRSGDG